MVRILGVLGVVVLALAACGSTHTRTVTKTSTVTRTVDPNPLDRVRETSCPFLGQQFAAETVGMRLARITVLHQNGRIVGCRIYALQGSPLSVSERLPPANQPVIEILFTRYGSTIAANNAVVKASREGHNYVRAKFGGITGVCFQIPFYPPDDGRDWACAYNRGALVVQVRTVVVSPALNVILLTRSLRLP
jgi:hypothetical protein